MRVALSIGVLVIVAASATARAQPALAPMTWQPPSPAAPSPGYVAAGVELSADKLFINAAVDIEAGYRLPNSPLAIHALIGRGGFGGAWMVTARGVYSEYRAGIEAERCITGGWLCGVAGVDVGYQRQRSTNDIAADVRSIFGYARAGVEVHHTHLRFGVMIDVRGGPAHDRGMSIPSDSGGGGTATLGYQF